MTIEFRQHGAHVDNDYPEYWLPDPSSHPRDSVVYNEDGNLEIYVRRYGKREQASSTSRTMGRLRHVYADAIEYAGTRGVAEKGSLMAGVVIGMPLILGGAWMGPWLGGFTACLGIHMLCMFASGLLFRLKTLPVVFDRQHRKVYRLLPNEGTGVMGVLRRKPLVACEYDWDLIDVESHRRSSITRGGTKDCSLIFRVRRSREDATMIGWFDIDVRELAQGNVDPMWEHIRRFMEEDGPHRPDPAEPLLRSRTPLSFWESLGMTGQWKPVFLLYWGTSPLRSALSLPLFLMGLPFRLLAGMEVYLKEKTRLPVRWPDVVLARIGPRLPASLAAAHASSTP